MIFLEVGLVIRKVATSEVDSSVGRVEQLDPTCPLTVSVCESGGVLDQDFSDDEVREVLCPGASAG